MEITKEVREGNYQNQKALSPVENGISYWTGESVFSFRPDACGSCLFLDPSLKSDHVITSNTDLCSDK